MEFKKFTVKYRSGLTQTRFDVLDESDNLLYYSKKDSFWKASFKFYDEWDNPMFKMQKSYKGFTSMINCFECDGPTKFMLYEAKLTAGISSLSIHSSRLGMVKLIKPNIFKGKYLIKAEEEELGIISRKMEGLSFIYGMACKDDDHTLEMVSIAVLIAWLTAAGSIS